MKKIASILLLVLTFAIDVHAELNEVRGILTKQEARKEGDRVNEYYYYFIFINENAFPVWLDMELYCEREGNGCARTGIYVMEYSKSITLQAGETYEWRPGEGDYVYGRDLKLCYTKYKAYKKQ